MKYPVGIQSFERIIQNGYVYVDKTDKIYSLANEGSIYFLSRPRRFGKSLLISTLENYFLGRKDLFEGLKIAGLEKEWKQHAVFRLDFNGIDFTALGVLQRELNDRIAAWEAQYGLESPSDDYRFGFRCERIFRAAKEQTGLGVVVLVDEYDKPLLDVMEVDEELLARNRETLKAFYSVFKLTDDSLRFVFLTGVTKFSQITVFSGFNQPKDISMLPDYEALCGITEDEITEYFTESIHRMAESLHLSAADVRERLKQQYDGYHFSYKMQDIYNPFSLLNALDDCMFSDYWFATGTPTYLIRLLRHYNENMDELTGKYYQQSEFMDYCADIERPLPMIYQSGYLTIKGYDSRRRRYLLDFPNAEVQQGFLTMIANNYLNLKQNSSSLAEDLVIYLEDNELEQFRTALTAFFASIPYTMRRKSGEFERERYFHYTFYLLLRLMSVFTVYTEKEQSQGRVDCIIETPKYVYIFEFKLDGTAAQALRQIEDKGYARPYADDPRSVRLIGVNFSSEKGTIDDWAVKA
ncbi:protein containing DUF1703 [gut metagenome]|uniref:Protein containing DUF1703 n=1 Tax=gut metagenome TaxID=749906 RepID=J9GKW4_9ZZZZ